ncbi:helix-turn-helix domain-containing protein [Viridibacillus arvi]|uniref:helix-turn-helix domain-containing protein n=1 Tax=Viridibacillus arvi TaxID=263475 RepID=UPI003D2C5B05
MAENINGVVYEGLLSKGYGLIPQMITRDKELSIEAKAIYGYLSAFAGNNNEAFPSVELICAELGISENRYRKHRKALLDKGFIRIRRERLENGFSKNFYELVQMIPESVPRQNVGIRNVGVGNVGIQSLGVRNEGTNSNSLKSNSLNTNNNKNYQSNNKQQPVVGGGMNDPKFAEIVKLYQDDLGPLTIYKSQELGYVYDEHGYELTLEATKEMLSAQDVNKPIKYIESILNRWKRQGVTDIQTLNNYRKRGENNAVNQSRNQSTNAREYSDGVNF